MAITCTLGNQQLEVLYAVVYKNMQNVPEGTPFDVRTLMSRLYEQLKERQGEGPAVEYVQAIPYLAGILSYRLDDVEISPETDLRNLARTLMNPETGYAETLKLVGGGLTPEQLSIIAEAEEEASEDEEPAPVKPRPEFKDTDDYKADNAFTSTFEEYLTVDPNKKPESFAEQIDPDKSYIYATLRKINDEMRNDLGRDLNTDFVFQGKTLKLKTILLSKLSANDRTEYSNNFVLRANSIKNPDPKVKKPNEIVALVVTDEKGNYIYFDNNGNVSTKEKGGRIVYQMMRDARKEGNKYRVTDIYGRTDQIQTPEQIAENMMNFMGYKDKAAFEEGEKMSFTDFVKDLAEEQQKQFKALYELRNSIVEGGKSKLLKLTSISTGVRIKTDPNQKVTLQNLSGQFPMNSNEILSSMLVLNTPSKGFEAGAAVVNIEGETYKVDRSDITEDLARKIAKALTSDLSDEDKNKYYSQFFIDKGFFGTKRHYAAFKKGQFLFTYDTYTEQEMKLDKAKAQSNKRNAIDLKSPTAEEDIYKILMSGKSSASGTRFPAKIRYDDTALDQEVYLDFQDGKLVSANYLDFLTTLPAQIFVNGAKAVPFYNSYMRFRVPTELSEKIDTAAEKAKEDAEKKSVVRTNKDDLADAIKASSTKSMTTTTMGMTASGITQDGKPYANFKIANPIKEGQAVKIYLEQKQESENFKFPKHGQKVLLEVATITVDNKVIPDVVQVFDYTGDKKGILLGQAAETDYANNESERDYTAEPGDIVEEKVEPKTSVQEQINKVINNPNVSQPSDKGTGISGLFSLDRKTALPQGVTAKQIDDAKKWWSNSPLNKYIELSHLANIVNSDAYARFIVDGNTLANGGKLAKIELYKSGSFADVYHEAWHGFSQLYLTRDEKTKLYNEVLANDPELKKASPYKIEEKIEEKLAEDFRTYALNQKTKKGSPVRNTLFRKIWNFIKKLFGVPGIQDMSPNLVEQNDTVTELFNKLYMASENPSLLNTYTPLVDNVMFDVLNRGINNVNLPKEDALNKQDAVLVSESIDSVISEIVDEVNNDPSNNYGKSATLKLLTKSQNKVQLYELVRQRFQERLKQIQGEGPGKITYMPEKPFNSFQDVDALEKNAAAIIRDKDGNHKYVFLRSQIDDYNNLDLDTKAGTRQKGELYKETIEIISDFYKHKSVNNINDQPADILIVTDIDEAKNQYDNYVKGGAKTFTSIDINEDVVNTLPQVPYEQSQELDNVRILQTALNNWGDPTSGVIKYHIENSRFDLIRQKVTDIDAEKDATGDATASEKFDKKAGEMSLLEMADQEIVYILKSLFKQTKKGTKFVTTNNKLGFKDLGNFNQNWKNTVRTLNGITDPKQMYTAIVEASKIYPEFEQLLNKIPDPSLPTTPAENDIITSMWQTFQKPAATLLQLTGFKQDDGSIITELTNAAVDVANTIREFGNRFKADTRDAYIERIDNQSMLNVTALIRNFSDSNGNLDPDKAFKFLNAMGFYLDDLKVIKDELNSIQGVKKYGVDYIFNTIKAISYSENAKTVSKAAADVISEFKKDPLATLVKGISPQVVGPPSSFVYTKGSKQKNFVEKIAGLQVKYGVDASNFTALNPERNLVNKHIEHSSASMIINGFNQATKLEDFWKKDELKYMSSFNPAVNPFVEDLQITKSLFDLSKPEKARRTSRSLDLILDMGTQIAEFTVEDEDGNKITKSIGTNTTSLDQYSKFLQEFHTFFKGGLQEFLRAGSKSTAMALRIEGGIMSEIGDRKDPRYYVDLDKFLPEGNAESFAFDNIILPYISAETERINRFKNSSIAKNYTGYNREFKNGKMYGESYVYFDSILDADLQEKILTAVNKPGMKLKDYVKNDPKLYDAIKKQVTKYFNDSAEEVYEYLQKAKYIDKTVMDRLNVPNLTNSEKERILAKAYMYNAWIHNFEVSQVIFGDIAQFNHKKEEFHKRTSGAISSGPKIRTDKAFRDFINDVNSKETGFTWDRNAYAKTLGSPDYVKFTYNGTVNTAIMQDAERDSVYKPIIEKAIREDYEKRYAGKPNAAEEVEKRVKIEADKYLEMTEADGQGYITIDAYRTLKKGMNKWTDQQEALYQKVVSGQEITAADVVNFFPVFKLQNYGNLAGTVLPVTAMHKFALMPLIPSVIKGSDLETLHHEMLRNNIQYATFASGSKVGGVTADGKPDNIFADKEQKIIKDKLTLTPNTVYVEYLKESASVPDYSKGKVVFATQLRKLLLNGLYESGKLINTENESAANRYKAAVDNYTNLLKLELLDEINFKKVGDTYKGNIENLLKLIQRELRRKDMPEHLVEAIGLNEDGTLKNDLSIHLDAQTIEKTIMSIVEKRFVKQKLYGEALVQVSSTLTRGMWSSGIKFTEGTEAEREKLLGSNTLPFYEPGKDGNTNAMKVSIGIQGEFNNLLNKEWKGEKIGTIQRLNELIKDEEWLNTDDNRKSITLSAVRIPVQGLNSMEFMEVYHFMDPSADNMIFVPSELVAKSGGDFDVDKLTTFFPHIASDGTYVTSKENTKDFINKINAEREKTNKSFAGQIKAQKKAAENEILESIKGVLELPDNYVNLVRPNDTYILQDISEELENIVSDYDRFVGGNKEGKKITPSITLHPLYNVHKHGVNMEGKDVLGIAANENAISPVFDSIGAAMPKDYYLTKFNKKLGRDVELKDRPKVPMRLFLPHNKTEDGRISLSKIYDVDGINSVAELFSQAINGTVDVEKNPWIFFIQGNMEVASTLFYLFKAGVPVRDAIFFVSNPLVRQYVDNQKRLKSAYGEFTGDAPKNQNFVKYNSAEMVINGVISQLLRNVVKEHKGDMFVVTQGPFDFKPKVNRMSVEVFIEEIRNGNLEVPLIKRLEKISGSPQTKILYTKPEITSTTYAKSVSNYVNKPNVLKNGVFSSADMEKLVKEPGQENSNLAISMFLHYLEIEKQLKGIATAKSNAKPDTQTFKSPQEILYRDVNIELLANNSKVDPTLMTSLQNDSVLSSLFDKEIIMSMLNPLFKLRDNTLLNDFILSKIRLNADLIKANFGQGKDGASRFIDEYKNAMINFIYQNYMSNIIDSNGKISNRPDDYRGYKVTTNNSQEKDVVINKDAEGTITGISVNYDLIESDYNNNLYLGKNNAVDNSYFKRGLKTFKEVDALFPDKTSFIKFVIEREYLREVYKDTIPAASLEMYLADKALMNTFNRTAIMKDNEHSYTDKIMNIIKNFPQLKAQFPILEQISRVPSKTGDNVLTLNDRKIISGSEAQIYLQNIKQLADPNIKKVENDQANKAISDVFGLFPQMMIYQHGVGKSKYGFNLALPVDKYNTIMKYASKVFSDNYMNNNAFQIIFDRLTQVKTPFKSYMLDAEKLSEAGNRRLSPEALKLANEVAPGFIQSSYDEDQIIEFFDELSKINESIESAKETADKSREFLKDFLIKYPQYNEKTKIKERKTANFAIAQILIYNELVKEQSETDEEGPTPGTQLSLFGEEPTEASVSTTNNAAEFTNYSGGAIGGDTVWAEVGKEYGLGKQVDYTPATLKKLTSEQLQEVESAYQKAVKDLGRKPLAADTYSGGLVRRDYLQAKAADAVYAVGTLVDPGQKDLKGYVNKTNKKIVSGGTGYAVQMAINLDKTVFVFNQADNTWWMYDNTRGEFGVYGATPILTKNFAGIGTREINEVGKQAIRDVYENTFKATKPTQPTAPVSTGIQEFKVGDKVTDKQTGQLGIITKVDVAYDPNNPELNFVYVDFQNGDSFEIDTRDLVIFTEKKDTEEDDSDDLDNNCTNPFLGE